MLDNTPSKEEISSALLRLLEAPNFRLSGRNKRFLRYVVEETLADRAERIKSYSVAVDVFERRADFDGGVDSIVRTEASRIRSELARYYAADGAVDPIRILLPPGSYAPRFERRALVAAAQADDQKPPAAQRTTPPVVARLARRRFALAALGIIAFVAAALPFWSRNGDAFATPTIILAMTQPIGDEPSIRAMAKGLTQSLGLSLTRYSGLSVAHASDRLPVEVIAARQKNKDALYVLESSLDADDARLRFRWRLVSAVDQKVLWSDQIDQTLGQAPGLNVEDQIAAGVATRMAARGGLIALNERYNRSKAQNDSYECVLQGFGYMATLSVAQHAQARACLERTVAEDPNNAEAQALLSYVYIDETRNGFNPRGDSADIAARALAASDRAVGLAPFCSLVHQTRSVVLFQTGDYAGFERAARRAIELNPGNPDNFATFGNRLYILGRYQEGVAMLRKALALDPWPPAVLHTVTMLESYRLGDFGAAAREAETVDFDPNYYFHLVILAAIYGQLQEKERAAANVAKILALRPDYARTFRQDWRNRRFQEKLIDAVADGLMKAGLPVI